MDEKIDAEYRELSNLDGRVCMDERRERRYYVDSSVDLQFHW
jgi:hypothetical protein